jgi:uncharacterized protein YuzE
MREPRGRCNHLHHSELMSKATVTIAGVVFDDIDYDRDADVLYLSVGKPSAAVQTYGTPEGHAVRYGAEGEMVGVTLVSAKRLLDRGELDITVPQIVGVRRDELETVLAE